MKKADRITAFVEELGAAPDLALDPCYQGYFLCFNDRRYYEAHDVLEHLWLRHRDENHAFYKGLIQLAGAFVHLQKQFLRPDHPKDGRRLRPAVRLFELARRNLEPYRPWHLHFHVETALGLCANCTAQIIASEFAINPWSPERAPQLTLDPSGASPPSGSVSGEKTDAR